MPACLITFPFILETQVDFDAPLGYKEPERQVQHEESTVSCSSLSSLAGLASLVMVFGSMSWSVLTASLYLVSTGASVATSPAFLPALLPGDGPAVLVQRQQ